MSKLLLHHSSGARAEIYMYGATVTAFYTAKEPHRNVLFLSKKSNLDGSTPIRGGIPVVFPTFGSVKGFPKHGFARISNAFKATLVDQAEGKESEPTVATFVLHHTDKTRKLWPSEFELVYEVKLFADRLVTSINVCNKSKQEPMLFKALIHSYLSVDDIRDGKCIVEGLKGLEYDETVQGNKLKETRAALRFEGETDSVYWHAPAKITVNTTNTDGTKRVIEVEKHAFLNHKREETVKSDVVIWNPWIDRSKGMQDFEDDEYIKMLCVEPGKVTSQQSLAPGAVFTLEQTLRSTTLPAGQASPKKQKTK